MPDRAEMVTFQFLVITWSGPMIRSNYNELKEDNVVKKHYLLSILCGLFISLLSFDSNAYVSPDLYSANMVVADQSTASRNSAIKEMLGLVLVKVSGQSKIAQNSQIKAALKSALSFASEFSFSDEPTGTVLSVSFNEVLIDRLLKKNGFTLWDSRRPTVMLWMVYETDDGTRTLLNSQTQEPLLDVAKQIAAVRGLPLLLPIWDLDDQLNVSVGDIWGQFDEKVAVANSRYVSDYMVLAKVTNHGISHQVSWSVFKMASSVDIFGHASSDISMTGTDETADIAQALSEIVNQSTDFFAAQYSVDTSESEGELIFTLTNVDSLTTYAKIKQYLKSIKAVEEVTLISAKSNEYRFKISLLGSTQSFLEVIGLDSKMSKITNYDPSLVLYQWRG